MNIKKNLFFLCVIMYSSFYAQQSIIDSLENELENPLSTKEKLENLISLGHHYSMIDPDKGLIKLDSAIEIALERKDSFRLALAYSNKGKNYVSLGLDSLAFEFYDNSEKIYELIDSTDALSKAFFNRGLFYSQRSDFKNAVKYVNKAFDIFSSNRDTLLMGYALGALGFYKTQLSDYVGSMDDFTRSLSLLELINKEESIFYGTAQGNMGVLYQKLNQFENAKELHLKALEIFIAHDHQFLMASQFMELGNVYENQNNLKKALYNYKAGLEINKITQNMTNIASSYSNIGLVYSHLEEYSKALSYFDSASIINKRLKDYGKLCINYHNRGETYYYLNDIQNAKKSFDSSLEYAKDLSNLRIIYETKTWIAHLDSIQGNFKNAYATLHEADIIRDSIMSHNKLEEIANLKAKYEYDKKKAVLQVKFEKDKELNQAKIRQQIFVRNMIIGGSALAMILLITGFFLIRRKREAELKMKLSKAELKTLKAQLNPHFIFNTLNSINDYISKNERTTASNYLTRFSKMMRKILDNSREEEITLEEEIEFLEAYIKLEQERLEHRFNYTISVSKELNTNEIFIPLSSTLKTELFRIIKND
jgi:tetratricopeptide (TPR) repeat protein